MENNKNIEELRVKISTEFDFINSKKHKYSLKQFLKNNPDGTTDNIIALFLCVTPNQVRELYDSAVKKIRQKLNINVK